MAEEASLSETVVAKAVARCRRNSSMSANEAVLAVLATAAGGKPWHTADQTFTIMRLLYHELQGRYLALIEEDEQLMAQKAIEEELFKRVTESLEAPTDSA